MQKLIELNETSWHGDSPVVHVLIAHGTKDPLHSISCLVDESYVVM